MRERRRLGNRDARLPVTGTAAGVGDGEDVDFVKVVAVVNGKGKAAEAQTLNLRANSNGHRCGPYRISSMMNANSSRNLAAAAGFLAK